jgi:hypothetical protein
MSAYYQKNKEKILARLKEKYATDLEFREKVKKAYSSRYKEDKIYQEVTRLRAKKNTILTKTIETIQRQEQGQEQEGQKEYDLSIVNVHFFLKKVILYFFIYDKLDYLCILFTKQVKIKYFYAYN